MQSSKELLNSLPSDLGLRKITDAEMKKLRTIFLEAYKDLVVCCEKLNITVMLIGGGVIGAVRHKGFIPWDDDLDVAMTRRDYEILKKNFESYLGDKYILSAPNYRNSANNRFPMMLVKNTLYVELGDDPDDETSKIKIDIFIIENIPNNKIIRVIKGSWCMLVMYIANCEKIYENQNELLKRNFYQTKEGKKMYDRRIKIGRFFSFYNFQKWVNIVDKSVQYKKATELMGIPTGRGHYFKEIRPKKTFVPVSKGEFEGLEVNLPGDPEDYLSNLYGSDYMTLPPVEKREKHFIVDLKFM